MVSIMKKFALFLSVLLFGGSVQAENPTVRVPVIDFAKDYPLADLELAPMVDKVEYIALETTDAALIKNVDALAVCDSLIVVTDCGTKQILTFNRHGKFLHKIANSGSGPEQYSAIRQAYVDFDRGEVFIWNHPLAQSILVYTLDGRLKRKLKISEKCWPDEMIGYDSDRLLVYAENNPRRYLLVNKDNGSITPLNLNAGNQNVANKVYTDSGAQMIGIQRLIMSGGQPVISDFKFETIYAARNGKLVPILKRQNIGSNEDGVLSAVTNQIGDYIILSVIPRRIDKRTKKLEIHDPYALCVNTKTSRVFKIDDIDTGIYELGNTNLPKNVNATSYTYDILDLLHSRGKLTGQIKHIYQTMTPDDNPIIKLTTFTAP